MKDFAVNIAIVGLVIVLYYFDILSLLSSKYLSWGVGIFILVLLAAAVKILGNPFAKDDNDD